MCSLCALMLGEIVSTQVRSVAVEQGRDGRWAIVFS